MLTWSAFEARRPDLAAAGRDLLYHFGVGLGFLATVRRDGGPRVHPICPLLADRGLYAWLIPSPKLEDVKRDGRYALHGYPLEENEDAVYLTGRAEVRADADLRSTADDAFWAERPRLERPADFESQTLVELLVGSCLLTRTTGHGDPNPQHTVWHGRG